MKSILLPLLVLAAALGQSALGLTINADFGRDTAAQNPGANPAPVLFSGPGPAPDTGTLWNDLRVAMAVADDQGADTVLHPVLFSNLKSSDNVTTAVSIQLTSGFYRSFNGAGTMALQDDRVFSRLGQAATMTIGGLDPAKVYDVYFIASGNFTTAYTIGGTGKVATGNAFDGAWTQGGEYVSFTGIAPTVSGQIVVTIQDGAAPIDSFGSISGLQIATSTPVRFLYPASATTTGGQFNASYPPTNLLNGGFTSPANTINTTTDYLAPNNNYATPSGTTGNFDLTFEFAIPTELDGMHVWNYIFRSGATSGSTSGTFGVNAYTLTFYTGPGATGATIGPVFSGALAQAQFNALNAAQSVYFSAPYQNVRSVVMHVISNHGGTVTGMNEVAFNGGGPFSITSFTSSAAFVQRPATATLNRQVSGAITSLEIQPAIGDVLPLTSGGAGSVSVSPLGEQTYTLTLNGALTRTLSVVGLPTREKLHLYLLIGQSNMQGVGTPYDAVLDAPNPRVVKFGSRDSRENLWVKGGHPLTALTTASGDIGMGVEFGKSMLAAQSDPEIVIGLINHAMGASAIQWWAPGVIDNDQINPSPASITPSTTKPSPAPTPRGTTACSKACSGRPPRRQSRARGRRDRRHQRQTRAAPGRLGAHRCPERAG
ncbi:MAG: sialate O-acetylesterase [Chthoniobacteraceae bacterium]